MVNSLNTYDWETHTNISNSSRELLENFQRNKKTEIKKSIEYIDLADQASIDKLVEAFYAYKITKWEPIGLEWYRYTSPKSIQKALTTLKKNFPEHKTDEVDSILETITNHEKVVIIDKKIVEEFLNLQLTGDAFQDWQAIGNLASEHWAAIKKIYPNMGNDFERERMFSKYSYTLFWSFPYEKWKQKDFFKNKEHREFLDWALTKKGQDNYTYKAIVEKVSDFINNIRVDNTDVEDTKSISETVEQYFTENRYYHINQVEPIYNKLTQKLSTEEKIILYSRIDPRAGEYLNRPANNKYGIEVSDFESNAIYKYTWSSASLNRFLRDWGANGKEGFAYLLFRDILQSALKKQPEFSGEKIYRYMRLEKRVVDKIDTTGIVENKWFSSCTKDKEEMPQLHFLSAGRSWSVEVLFEINNPKWSVDISNTYNKAQSEVLVMSWYNRKIIKTQKKIKGEIDQNAKYDIIYTVEPA